MGKLSQLFDVEELAKLDEKQLVILRDLIEREIRTNPKVLEALKEKAVAAYRELTKKKK
jgi:hypothetical protein